MGSSCGTRKHEIQVLHQCSAVSEVVDSKHPPKKFHLHFPLLTASLTARALSLRMCYTSRGGAASMRKRLRQAMLQYRRCCPCCPYVTSRSYIGRSAGLAPQCHPMHAERHSIQSLSRRAGCHYASHAARKPSHLAADDSSRNAHVAATLTGYTSWVGYTRLRTQIRSMESLLVSRQVPACKATLAQHGFFRCQHRPAPRGGCLFHLRPRWFGSRKRRSAPVLRQTAGSRQEPAKW